MRETKIFRDLAVLVLLSLILTACGGGNATPAATQAPATQSAATESIALGDFEVARVNRSLFATESRPALPLERRKLQVYTDWGRE